MLQFQEERLFAAAGVLKTFDDLIQETVDYTKQRIAFGQPILNNQTVHFRLAELATEVELLRSLVYRWRKRDLSHYLRINIIVMCLKHSLYTFMTLISQ